MSSLAEQQAALTKDKAKITKIFAALKKLLSKEFLWVLFALILGLPLAVVFNYILSFASESTLNALDHFLVDTPRFIAAYVFSLAGIYFTRTVVGSVETLIKKENS